MENKNHLKMDKLLAKASHELALKKELLSDPAKILKREKIEMGSHQIKCFENKRHELHLVIPFEKLEAKAQLKKLPNHPTFKDIIRFLITMYQTNPEAKKNMLQDASAYLKKLHIKVPEKLKIHFHECTKDLTFFAIPCSIEGLKNEELSELELQAFSGGGSSVGSTFETGLLEGAQSFEQSFQFPDE